VIENNVTHFAGKESRKAPDSRPFLRPQFFLSRVHRRVHHRIRSIPVCAIRNDTLPGTSGKPQRLPDHTSPSEQDLIAWLEDAPCDGTPGHFRDCSGVAVTAVLGVDVVYHSFLLFVFQVVLSTI